MHDRDRLEDPTEQECDGSQIVLELPTDSSVLGIVRTALQVVVDDCSDVRLSSVALGEVMIAVQEACTNAIRHGFQDPSARRFSVEIRRRPDALEIRVRNRGAPFDIEGARAPEPEELSEGGYGITIMRAWMDEVLLTRENGCNVLTLVRRYQDTGEIALGGVRTRA